MATHRINHREAIAIRHTYRCIFWCPSRSHLIATIRVDNIDGIGLKRHTTFSIIRSHPEVHDWCITGPPFSHVMQGPAATRSMWSSTARPIEPRSSPTTQ